MRRGIAVDFRERTMPSLACHLAFPFPGSSVRRLRLWLLSVWRLCCSRRWYEIAMHRLPQCCSGAGRQMPGHMSFWCGIDAGPTSVLELDEIYHFKPHIGESVPFPRCSPVTSRRNTHQAREDGREGEGHRHSGNMHATHRRPAEP